MNRYSLILSLVSAFALATGARAEAPAEAAASKQPVLRVEAGGPTAFVTSLAFSPDGKTLYAAGFDKIVRVWTLDPRTHRFELSSTSYRVPIGPGLEGVINSIALSSDGAWLAVGGSALFRNRADFGQAGIETDRTSAMTRDMLLDQGRIFVFHTKTGEVRRLEGNEGVVMSLAFADRGPTLISAARERSVNRSKKHVGVIRVWDVEAVNGSPLRMGEELPDPVDEATGWVSRPGIAAWRVGKGAKEIRVAIASDDRQRGLLRIWDVARGQLWDNQEDGAYNNAIAYWPSEERLLTGSFRNPNGHVQAWDAGGRAGPAPARGIPLAAGYYPRELALFSAGDNGKLDSAAVIVRVPGNGEEFRLQIVDLLASKIANRSIPLWKGITDQPVLAAAPGGRHLAVAGNRDHTIHVFAIKDVLDGKAEPVQILQSVGVAISQVALVNNGKDRGLLLSSHGIPKRGQPNRDDLIFDITKRKLSSDSKGWDVGAGQRGEEEAREKVKRLDLQAKQIVTAQALLAAQPPFNVPILAVAVDELGETQLRLYNATTLEQFRRFTGHVNSVRSLSFSSDGKLLASAGDDQTICLWSLTDLDEVVGRQGQVSGFAVEAKGGGALAVADLDRNSLLPVNRQELDAKQVRKKDTVEGIIIKGKLVKVNSAHDFYLQLASVAPSETVTVRITGCGDVKLKVSQGIDERKPLLSLFVTYDRKTKQWDWLSWNPLGPYDASDRKVERFVGWHENLVDTEKRLVRFSLADEYRKQNFKPGILKDLVDYGNAGQAIDAYKRRVPPPPREPRMTLGIQEDDETVAPDEQGRFRVQQSQVVLTMNLTQRPAGKIQSLTWEMDGKNGKFSPAHEDSWSADLSGIPWKRGEYRVHVELRTEEPVAGPFTRDLTLAYQPARPTVKILSPTPRVVMDAKYPLLVLVAPGKGQEVGVRVLHKSEGKDLDEKLNWKASKEETTKETTLALEPGVNVIKVVARNEGASADDATDSNSQTFEVTYQTKQPQITLSEIELPDGTKRSIDRDSVLAVDSPSFTIQGEIEATENLTEANWSMGDAKKAKALEQFKGGQKNSATIREKVTLEKPGEKQTISFTAKAANSEEVKRQFTVVYHPRLPDVKLDYPFGERVLYEGKDKPAISAVASLAWPKSAYSCQAQVVVNGKAQGDPREIRGVDAKFTADVNLAPGNNEIAVRLSNQWQKEPVVTRKALIIYRRPPRIVALKQVAVSDKPPRVQIEATVESAKGMPLTHAEASSWKVRPDGLPPTQTEIKVHPLAIKPENGKEGAAATLWTLQGSDISLEEGKNEVRLVVRNGDGDCLESKTLTVNYVKPPEPKAVVKLLDPTDDKTVKDREYTIRFSVRSKSPLRKVTLNRDKEVLFDAKVAGRLEMEESKSVALARGMNTFYVVAQNDGGEQVSRPVVINCQYTPVVRIIFDRLENGKDVSTLRGEPQDRTVAFQPVQAAGQTLQGHVVWDKENDEAMAKLAHVRVYANGKQLLPIRLQAAKPAERLRTFRAELELDQADNNLIEVHLPAEVVLDATSHQRLTVNCAHPEPAKAFAHLLILSRDEESKEAARDRVLKALNAKLGDKNTFSMASYSEGGQLYGPLVRSELTTERVIAVLGAIRNNLQRRARAGKINDAVIVYYQGGENINSRGDFLTLSADATEDDADGSSIGLDYVRSMIDQNQGSRIWFLDTVQSQSASASEKVQGQCNDLVAQCDDPNIALWRYAWQGKGKDEPAEARLLTSLSSAFSSAGKLTEVSQILGSKFTPTADKKLPWYSSKYPLLQYNYYLPPGLQDWRLQP
ncbi:MAG: WD40 repeat domain-containing protein [Gemmataceae bacterium]